MSLLGKCYMWINGLNPPKRNGPPPGTFQHIVDSYWRHDETCKSLDFMWFGHSGGLTALDQIETCHECGGVFYWEGVTLVDNPDELYYLCECCERKPSDG